MSHGAPPTVFPWRRPNYAASASPLCTALWWGGALAVSPGPVKVNSAARAELAQHILGLVAARAPDRHERLAECGFWGLQAPGNWDGGGWPFPAAVQLLGKIAALDAPLAGVAQIHHCLGPLPALLAAGDAAQQARYLPPLVRGGRLSAFALTEPAAGADVTAVRTRATRNAAGWRLTGEKAFITNLAWGRSVTLIAREGAGHEAFVAELPDGPAPEIELAPMSLHCLPHTVNARLWLRGWQVPEESLLAPGGNGLRLAYHLLNHGRTALAAVSAGRLRAQLAALLPWVRRRRSRERLLAELPLVQRRLARVAAAIVACELLAEWCAGLLEAGFRCDLEAKLVKAYAAAALREAATEWLLPTYGGRAFLRGQAWGEQLFDLLAPSIYEGENELLQLSVAAGLLQERAAHGGETACAFGPCEAVRQALLAVEASAGFRPEACQCELADLAGRLAQAVVAWLAEQALAAGQFSPLPARIAEYLAQHSSAAATNTPSSPSRARALEREIAEGLCGEPECFLGALPLGAIALDYED